MGWASGSLVMDGVIDAAKQFVPDDQQRKKFYYKIIETLKDQDWDTEDECLGDDPVYDEIYAEKHGEDWRKGD